MTQIISKLILCGVLCSMQIAFANEKPQEQLSTIQNTLDSIDILLAVNDEDSYCG